MANVQSSAGEHEEPIAIVGLGGVFPPNDALTQFWERCERGEAAACVTSQGVGRSYLSQPVRARFLETAEFPFERFKIPPIHARSIGTVLTLMLEVVDQAVRDAGYPNYSLPSERTDVVAGTCAAPGRLVANGLRIEAARYVARSARLLREHGVDPSEIAQCTETLHRRYDGCFGGGFNDKLYETGGTLPARISLQYRLRGRSLCVDAADLTSFAALDVAVANLRQGACDAAIVVCAQLLESAPLVHALQQRELLASDLPVGITLGEAGVACVLKRRADARRDGDRVRAYIRGIGFSHSSEAGPVRYGGDVDQRVLAIERAYARAGYGMETIQYLEYFGAGLARETDAEFASFLRSLAGKQLEAPIELGCAKPLVGHTFASAGLVSLAKVVSAMERGIVAPHAGAAPPCALREDLFSVPARARAWRRDPKVETLRAGISGAGLGGGHAHLTLERESPSSRFDARPKPSTVAARTGRRREPIAVIALAARFPNAPTADGLWERIVRRENGFQGVCPTRIDRELSRPGSFDASCTYTELGAPVERAIAPDQAGRLGLPPGALQALDPAQQLALATVDDAVAQLPSTALTGEGAVLAATPLTLLSERRRAVVLECERLHREFRAAAPASRLSKATLERVELELDRFLRQLAPTDGAYVLDSVLASAIASHVANARRLRARAYAVQSACASTLAALDIACRGLAAGDLDYALICGVELGVNYYDFVLCSRMRLLSPGRIRPFDADADGFSLGEGCGAFALRRLCDAKREALPVRAVIRAIGWSSDARSMIAPDAEGQALAMTRAFEQVEFGADDVDYVETHGTGTEVGDLSEATALRRVYGTGTRAKPLVLGSVKANVGHTLAASGAAGLTAAILALEARTLPALAHTPRSRSALRLEDVPARILDVATPWPAPATAAAAGTAAGTATGTGTGTATGSGEPRRAAVSGFGTGGINYHVLLEEASKEPMP